MNIKRTLAMTVAATALTAGVAVPNANASLNLFTNCPVIGLVNTILGGVTSSTGTKTTTSTPTKTTTSTGTKTTTSTTTTKTPTTTTTTKPSTTAGNV